MLHREEEEFDGFGPGMNPYDTNAGRATSTSSLVSDVSIDSAATTSPPPPQSSSNDPAHKTLVASGVSNSELWRFGLQFGGGSAKDNLRRLSMNLDETFTVATDQTEDQTEDGDGTPGTPGTPGTAGTAFGLQYTNPAHAPSYPFAFSPSPSPTPFPPLSTTFPASSVYTQNSPRPAPSSPKLDPRRFPATQRTVGSGSPKSHRATLPPSSKRHGSTSSVESDDNAGANTSMQTLLRKTAPQSKIWSGAVAVRSSVDFFNSSPLVQRKGSSSSSSCGGDGGSSVIEGPPHHHHHHHQNQNQNYQNYQNHLLYNQQQYTDSSSITAATSTPKLSRRKFFRRSSGSGKGKNDELAATAATGSPLLRRAVDLSGKQYGKYSDAIGVVRPASPIMMRSQKLMTRAEQWLSEQHAEQR